MKMKCPDMNLCKVKLSEDFAKRICHSGSHINCHHFAKRHGNLKTAIEWSEFWHDKRRDILDESWRDGEVEYKRGGARSVE